MAQLFWTADAAEDRTGIRAFIATENVEAAKVRGVRELVPHPIIGLSIRSAATS
jgi:plasmid stabilization system protein ParE